VTRRDKCHLAGIRAAKLSPAQAARAWQHLATELESLGTADVPKFKHLFSAIRNSTIEGHKTMPKFVTKPVVIEAVQHFGDMGTRTAEIPVWLIDACSSGVVFARGKDTFIKTLNGDVKVSDGDYIIRGVKGEIYPFKPDIFDTTYSSAETTHQQRVVTEKTELDVKINALQTFISYRFTVPLPIEERARLQRQLSIMLDYSHVLGERIAAFK
jgi:hypothetical protein